MYATSATPSSASIVAIWPNGNGRPLRSAITTMASLWPWAARSEMVEAMVESTSHEHVAMASDATRWMSLDGWPRNQSSAISTDAYTLI